MSRLIPADVPHPTKAAVNPHDDDFDQYFRVADREKLDLMIATIRLLKDSDVKISIYGPPYIVTYLRNSIILNHDRPLTASALLSTLPASVQDEGLQWRGSPTVIIDYDQFGLAPLRDVDLAYCEMWQGRIPSPVGRIKVTDDPCVGLPTSTNESLRSIEAINAAYPSKETPVMFYWVDPKGGVKSAPGILYANHSLANRYVQFSHMEFLDSRYTVFGDPDGRPATSVVTLSLNPSVKPADHMTRNKLVAVPMAYNRTSQSVPGVYHYGSLVNPTDLQHRSADAAVVKDYAADFFLSMLAIPESADLIVLHLPESPVRHAKQSDQDLWDYRLSCASRNAVRS